MSSRIALTVLVLNRIATDPSHQRQSAGSMPVSWHFERADREGTVCRFNTAEEGISLYGKIGIRKGRWVLC